MDDRPGCRGGGLVPSLGCRCDGSVHICARLRSVADAVMRVDHLPRTTGQSTRANAEPLMPPSPISRINRLVREL
jgi:hypothetical protein